MERWKKLAYDVGVNVVANLIAAAIIYLLAAWVGLLPRNSDAFLAAYCALLFAPAIVLAVKLKLTDTGIVALLTAVTALVAAVLVFIKPEMRSAWIALLIIFSCALLGALLFAAACVRVGNAGLTGRQEDDP